MRKGQVEIVGLLIIVLMISFILLFAMRTLISGDGGGNELKEDLVSSLLTAMLETSSNCVGSTTISDLLQDYAKYAEHGGASLISCANGQNSKDFVNDSINTMLEGTLGAWEYPYEFRVTVPSSSIPIIRQVAGNDTGKSGSSQNQPLPLGDGSSFHAELCIGRCVDIDI